MTTSLKNALSAFLDADDFPTEWGALVAAQVAEIVSIQLLPHIAHICTFFPVPTSCLSIQSALLHMSRTLSAPFCIFCVLLRTFCVFSAPSAY